eukprot:CAMPEP_0172917974 /NCGR_PEP_ID=MMETSP1075-20121228/199265_1 /TAXON_ID=2916 /ORGANISM="Ceratium fusus, Strain PA161109" /LENGTH=79 /DNA_ID=CAMNT_0013777531 /DNA_START=121 /DNA_END=364 /DNA_ORIENTATION=+
MSWLRCRLTGKGVWAQQQPEKRGAKHRAGADVAGGNSNEAAVQQRRWQRAELQNFAELLELAKDGLKINWQPGITARVC